MRAKTQPTVSVDDRLLLKALIHRPPVPIQMVDELPGNMGALYDHDQQVIFVRRGMDAPNIFRSVSMELAHAEIGTAREDYTRDSAAFSAYCASYMLCRKTVWMCAAMILEACPKVSGRATRRPSALRSLKSATPLPVSLPGCPVCWSRAKRQNPKNRSDNVCRKKKSVF